MSNNEVEGAADLNNFEGGQNVEPEDIEMH